MYEDCQAAVGLCECDRNSYDIRNCSGRGRTGQLYKLSSCKSYNVLGLAQEFLRCTYGFNIQTLDLKLFELRDVCCISDLTRYCLEEIRRCKEELRKATLQKFKMDIGEIAETIKRHVFLNFDCKNREYYNSDNCTDPLSFNGGSLMGIRILHLGFLLIYGIV